MFEAGTLPVPIFRFFCQVTTAISMTRWHLTRSGYLTGCSTKSEDIRHICQGTLQMSARSSNMPMNLLLFLWAWSGFC